MAVKDEIELITAMYEKNELQFEECSGYKRIAVNLLDEKNRPTVFSCNISEQYPDQPPMISVQQPNLTKNELLTLKSHLLSDLQLNCLVGQPMLLNVINWVKANVYDFCKPKNSNYCISSNTQYVYIIQLDHMRSKSRYIKHLQQFTKELDVACHLVFVEHFIFLFLCGNEASVKQFIVLQKTCKVDIDSSRQPCKEKMLTVLGKVQVCDTKNFNYGFSNSGELKIEELNQYLQNIGYNGVYNLYLLPIIKKKK